MDAAELPELFTLKLRFKQPDGDTSRLQEFSVDNKGNSFDMASKDFRFAASVAGFGMLLRRSKHAGKLNLDWIEETASTAIVTDPGGYKGEFIDLVRRAKNCRR